MNQLFTADLIYYKDEFRPRLAIEVENGKIARIEETTSFSGQALPRENLSGYALMPGTVNVHNHSFQSLVRGFGDDLKFFDWRDQGIYKYSLDLGPEEIYAGALFAFGEMLTYGVTTVCDFFYLHDGGNDNSRAVIRAAKDLGIRLVLARTLYDWEAGPKKYRETVAEATRRCLELMQELKDDPMITVCPAPHSPHAASPEMIQAGFELARKHNRRCHIHVAEGQYEVDMITQTYGATPMRWLDSLGCCTEEMVAVHCVWLEDEELDLMAERRVKLAYNPASNMFLGDGITNIREMLDRGITIGLGTDGACSNNRTSVFDEMRTASLLQKVKHLDSTRCTAGEAFKMGTENGGEVLGLATGKLEPGGFADFVAIDLHDITLQPVQNLRNNIVYAMSPRAIHRVVVGGNTVFCNGETTRIPQRDIVDKVRHVTRNW